MTRQILFLFAAAALLSGGACSAPPPAAEVAEPMPATGPATPRPPLMAGKLAAIAPDEARAVDVQLSLAHALDLCGFPALGAFIRDYMQMRIDTCPNTAERKTAFRALVDSAALRQQRIAAEARAGGDAPQCYASDRLTVIKEMIPVAQRAVARAEKPVDCSDISSTAP